MSITADDDVLHGMPRLEGTRISVLHIYDMAVRGEERSRSSGRRARYLARAGLLCPFGTPICREGLDASSRQ